MVFLLALRLILKPFFETKERKRKLVFKQSLRRVRKKETSKIYFVRRAMSPIFCDFFRKAPALYYILRCWATLLFILCRYHRAWAHSDWKSFLDTYFKMFIKINERVLGMCDDWKLFEFGRNKRKVSVTAQTQTVGICALK